FTYSGFPLSITTKATIGAPPSPITSSLSVRPRNKPMTSTTPGTHNPHLSRHLAAPSVHQTTWTTNLEPNHRLAPSVRNRRVITETFHNLDSSSSDSDSEGEKSFAVRELMEKPLVCVFSNPESDCKIAAKPILRTGIYFLFAFGGIECDP
ncbi:hypothetical protein M8C21_009781, partial [Ambrosia artemisiifolia]